MGEDAINYLMNMTYQETIKHMKIPYEPNHINPPKRYIDNDEHKRKKKIS